MKNSEQPAFPVKENKDIYPGLTKREYFAGLALQGVISKRDFLFLDEEEEEDTIKNMMSRAVNYADSLLKQLETTI